MNREEYRAYLRSPDWRKRRKEFLEEANNECQECGSKKRLQIHHLSYENVGDEEFDDVEVLCYECHQDKELEKGNDLDGDDEYDTY